MSGVELCPADPPAIYERVCAAMDIVHGATGPSGTAKTLSAGRNRPGLPLGGVVFFNRSKMLSLRAEVPGNRIAMSSAMGVNPQHLRRDGNDGT